MRIMWYLVPGALAIGWVLFDLAAHESPVSSTLFADQLQIHQRQIKCRDARVLFFTECMKSAPRESCEVQWASLKGHVFDGDPRNHIVDEINCGTIDP